ncbi:hypothetical protein [Dokdonella sp.]|uniref:hypothetical protein n=1 Tax=Dokdonella sp. TaxID=2291710 RepID=UPI001B1985CC|nr:hypothetical protein [Dokdonella sp.]MBO9662628.1 hypothetical protein [Dokdonella sp.]
MIRFRLLLSVALAVVAADAAAANPLRFLGETYSEWKERLFGSGHPTPAVVDAPAKGPIALPTEQPMRVRVDDKAPERDFPKGESRYRLVELPRHLDHAAVRVQVLALPNPNGRGKAVFKPLLYVFGDDGTVRAPIEAKPLNLDIRPFRRTRLLACVTLDQVRRFALATTPSVVGKTYESELREAVSAPTQYGFYYKTEALKTRLPYAATGEIIIEVTPESEAGKGC